MNIHNQCTSRTEKIIESLFYTTGVRCRNTCYQLGPDSLGGARTSSPLGKIRLLLNVRSDLLLVDALHNSTLTYQSTRTISTLLSLLSNHSLVSSQHSRYSDTTSRSLFITFFCTANFRYDGGPPSHRMGQVKSGQRPGYLRPAAQRLPRKEGKRSERASSQNSRFPAP